MSRAVRITAWDRSNARLACGRQPAVGLMCARAYSPILTFPR
jgi:hypothetical protein